MTTLILILIVLSVGQAVVRRMCAKPRVVAGIETTTRIVPAPEAPDYRLFIHPAYARKRGPQAEDLCRALAEFRRDDPALMGVDDLTRRVAAELRAESAS